MRAIAFVALVAAFAVAAEAAPFKKFAFLAVTTPGDATQIAQVKAALQSSFDKYKAANPTSGVTFWVAAQDKTLLPPPSANKKDWKPKDATQPQHAHYDIVAIWTFPSADAFAAYGAWKKANSNKDEWKALPIANKAHLVTPA